METARRNCVWVSFAVVLMACLRLAHAGILWADEDYHLAAAVHILNGKLPYRDFWYDKPPLNALFYLLVGGHGGNALRILDAGYVVLACWLAFRLARELWGVVEGYIAALLLAFFTTFYLPSAVIPFAPDALMIAPHLAAIYFAVCRKPLLAGVTAGFAFLFNTKAIFVLASCGVFLGSALMPLALGALVPFSAAFVSAGYREQVWAWGWIYAKDSPASHPVHLGFTRTANWLSFHGALLVSSIFGLMRIPSKTALQISGWIALSFVAVCVGLRFEPRYYLQLLPPLVIVGARGITLGVSQYRKCALIALSILLLVPLIRFGPRYVSLAFGDNAWNDTVMDRDSRAAAKKILALGHSGDTLFVWGYRPNLYVYTRMSSDSRFWDSQPISGVPADRHLSAVTPVFGGPAIANRAELVRSHPTFIVDGLSRLNPKLKPQMFPELRAWIDNSYEVADETPLSIIYRRKR